MTTMQTTERTLEERIAALETELPELLRLAKQLVERVEERELKRQAEEAGR